MSNFPINAVRDELMAFPHVETDRPIPAERLMRQLKAKAAIAKKSPSQAAMG